MMTARQRANVDLWDYVPSANAYRQHLYQTVDGKIVWPSVNGPIPATWPVLPAGKGGQFAPLGLTQATLHQVHMYLQTLCHGSRALGSWSYWHQGSPLSGPWLPTDTATIAALTSIGEDVPT
jgi:hypothetical protein